MAKVTIENLTKTYGKTTAVKNVNLDLENQEFFVLFGPAGAGKTTILNMIAGIGDPDEGKISFDGRNMNFIEPSKRNVAMVFENYALYPHMTVYDNIAAPLRSKIYRQPKDVIDREVRRVAHLLHLDELLNRKPSQISNGQKQRTALGRALVRNPAVFLLDEPLAHLDAKLRNEMRKELKAVSLSLETTTLYVTHDYAEAMSLGDRIAVINQGEICQVGTPNEIYYEPATEFVAKIFGDSEINIIPCEIIKNEAEIMIKMPWDEKCYPIKGKAAEALKAIDRVDLGLRSAGVRHSKSPVDGYVKGNVYGVQPLGNKVELTVQMGEIFIRLLVPVTETISVDDEIWIAFDITEGIFFDCQTKNFIAGQISGEERRKDH